MPVYFIHQEEHDQWLMKIGRTNNLRRRLPELQTGNPKQLFLVGWIVSDDDRATEKSLHSKYESRNVGGEWFMLQPADIVANLRDAGINGFVPTTNDPFEIVGYDRKGIPEYLGVWDWADLEIEECCPFCGCMCGMFMQDVSQMHYCLHCEKLTDFSELSPDIECEEDYLLWQKLEAHRKATRHKPNVQKRFVM